MTKPRRVSRRNALKLGAAAAALPLVHISTAYAAGKLNLGFWDHWVPAGNVEMKKVLSEWGTKNKVDIHVDFITTVGNKNLLTIAAEAQARTGHDILAFPTWEVHNHTSQLEPMDDVVNGLSKQYGKIDPITEYLAKVKGTWRAVPSSIGTQYKPGCARISLFKKAGFDVQAAYPNKPGKTDMAANWTYDEMLKIAPVAQKAGLPFALGLGQTTDSVDWVGSMFAAYGAELVDAKGKITVDSDPVRQVLEYMQKLTKFMGSDVFSFDDASNNRALISGKSALIFNPPSAWYVAAKDAPKVAADCWALPSPAGPKGRFVPYLPYFWGTWSFSKNKAAAKELLTYLCQRPQVERLCNAVDGYDIPPFLSMDDFKIWEEVKPPLGTVYNYPIRPWHGSKRWVAAYPAAPDIAVQIYNQATLTTLVAKCTQGGQTVDQAIKWAHNELQGFMM
ncbi:MAG TPA: extracellular solute-binding protein [Acetobacteraceae bacterium]|nr:extracellular solute-binding protein [Acetobacteraceae bacterium]